MYVEMHVTSLNVVNMDNAILATYVGVDKQHCDQDHLDISVVVE